MKVEWKGGKLSKKRALFLCFKLWEWLAKYQYTKEALKREDAYYVGSPNFFKALWPQWEENGGEVEGMRHCCPCCEYDCGVPAAPCEKCLLLNLWGTNKWGYEPCTGAPKSPFKGWVEARTPKTRKKYARIIAEAAKAEYIKAGGKI